MADTPKYIQERGGSYRVVLPKRVADKINGGVRAYATRDTLEQAIAVRDEALVLANPPDVPIIDGLTTEDDIDLNQVWERVFAAQDETARRERIRASQSITMPPGPFGLAYWSDWHLGDAGCDYRQLRADAEIIRDTPRMHALFLPRAIS